MLCHKLKFIFVHIPKTGGQSLENVFLQLIGLDWEKRAPFLMRPNDDPDLGPSRLAHLTASEYLSCGHISLKAFNKYFKFTFVRNPWDKLVSEYKFHGYASKISFKEFLFENFPEPGFSDKYRHVLPQYEFIFDDSGNQLVNFIGKFEKLQIDFNHICNELGIHELSLPHINNSLKIHYIPRNVNDIKHYFKILFRYKAFKTYKRNTFANYIEYYDNESKRFVEEYYCKDIEAFQYKFDPNSEVH